jgi:hypothetical protein
VIFIVLCLLLPFAVYAHVLRARDAVTRSANPLVRLLLDWPRPELVSKLTLALILALAIGSTIGFVREERAFLFDDSFISYHYSQNLADGHGLVWNPGQAPSEGYTNLLLVLVLAPVIRLGGDPLLATRVLSGLAALAMSVGVFRLVRRETKIDFVLALLLSIGFSVCSYTVQLSMLGLETVLFASALFFAYDSAQRFFETGRAVSMLVSGVLCWLAFLLRPEVVFLPVALFGAELLAGTRDRGRLVQALKLFALSFVLPTLLYLSWKLWYFGSIVPNPALVKIPGQGLIRPRGFGSIRDFMGAHHKLLLAAGLGLFWVRARLQASLAAALFVAIYVLFYLRVDTLMDQHTRFLYPTFPFLFVLALPALRAFVEQLVALPLAPLVRLSLVPVLFTLVFFRDPSSAVRHAAGGFDASAVAEREVHQATSVLGRVGKQLAAYPRISDVTVGSTDAGLMFYESRAKHVDMAGLCTRFIAEHKDARVLADYFFEQKPDLVIVRARIGGLLVTYEHGVLGDYSRWNQHSGWDGYRYVGGVHNGPNHDLLFYLRRSSPHEAGLQTVLAQVQDADVKPMVEPFGTPAVVAP